MQVSFPYFICLLQYIMLFSVIYVYFIGPFIKKLTILYFHFLCYQTLTKKIVNSFCKLHLWWRAGRCMKVYSDSSFGDVTV